MALFWFDAKVGIALFQFYKRWRLFRSLFREVFPFSTIMTKHQRYVTCYALKKRIQENSGNFIKIAISGQFNGHTPRIKLSSRRPGGALNME